MDTAKLELAAQRYRDAEEALNAAHTDLAVEVVAALRQTDEDGARDRVAEITGWTVAEITDLIERADSVS
ncbi:hypothetical protein, partial [Streptomyces sp. YIM 130001]|uniref:hypothetical protein n=1 Tax=Streptomyces sp. YIM 130001 TaxID=2259644 RepID=UPI000E6593E3